VLHLVDGEAGAPEGVEGGPGVLKAGAIPVAARIAQLSEFMEVAHRVGGVAGATELARKRAGRQFDPDLAALLCARAEEVFGGLEAAGDGAGAAGRDRGPAPRAAGRQRIPARAVRRRDLPAGPAAR